MATESAIQHAEETGHTIMNRDHECSQKEWCVQCGNYVADQTPADAIWDDPDDLEWL